VADKRLYRQRSSLLLIVWCDHAPKPCRLDKTTDMSRNVPMSRTAKLNISVRHLESISQSRPVSLANTSRGMPSTPTKLRPAPKSGLGSLRAHAHWITLLGAHSRMLTSGGTNRAQPPANIILIMFMRWSVLTLQKGRNRHRTCSCASRRARSRTWSARRRGRRAPPRRRC